jgi:hypothetical protein
MHSMKLPGNSEELLVAVRAEVLAALQRRARNAPLSAGADLSGSRRLIALFTGTGPACPDYIAQAAELARNGYSFLAAFSRTFAQHNDVEAVAQALPAATLLRDADSESALVQAADSAQGLVAAPLSLNTTAKLANAISDSLPTRLLLQMAMHGKPVIVAQDLGSLADDVRMRYPAVPPGLMRLVEDHFHKVQQLGVQFVAASSLADAVAAAFYQPSNETPQRLAVERPTPKRSFITAEDVWKARSLKKTELVCPPDAIITDQAREYAETHGIVLRQ